MGLRTRHSTNPVLSGNGTASRILGWSLPCLSLARFLCPSVLGSTFGLYDTGCLADYSTSTITRQGGVGWLSVACASPHSLQFLFFIWLGTDACFACGLSTYNWYLNSLALIRLLPERGAPAGTSLRDWARTSAQENVLYWYMYTTGAGAGTTY